MSVQRFALILIGFAAVLAVFVLLMRYRRQKAAVALRAYKKDYEAADHGPTASVPPTAAKRLMSVDVHYQLRSLVDDFPSMRSPTYLDYVEDYWVNERNRPEFNTYMIYKARWMRHCYPGPPTEVCELYQRTGRERCFVSIESGLGDAIQEEVAHRWACEASGAFLQANTLDAMRVAGMNYPILLRPAVQGGIDSQIECVSEPERTSLNQKLRLLQSLREEIEGRAVKSWWRPGGDPDPVSGQRSS